MADVLRVAKGARRGSRLRRCVSVGQQGEGENCVL